MDFQSVMTAITTVGFPCVMCVALLYFLMKQDERHDNTVKNLTETISENTKVLTELSTLIKTLTK